jgi:hypothetical protein
MSQATLRFISVLLLSSTLPSCLPADTRSPPGTVVLRVESDDAVRSGIPADATADGWSIHYERFLVVFGQGELAGDGCDAYVDSDYARIFDLLRPGPQRVNVLYGLGQCDLRFSISTPAWDTLRGEGVTETDELALRTPGTDSQADGLGVSVWVEGRADRLDESKRFSWPFRRIINYQHCQVETPGGIEGELSLTGQETVDVDVSIRGTTLFRESATESASVRFDPFRDADAVYGDANDVVTLAELERTPLTGQSAKTLADLVYLELLPEIVRYRGSGRCAFEATSAPDDWGGP